MSKVIIIKTGELAVSHNDDIIKTGSIGSCVVVSLYDSNARIGGLAHCMLAKRKTEKNTESINDIGPGNSSAKYVDEAIDCLLASLEKMGGKKESMVAKLVGGASMFRRLSGDNHGIGWQNVESARKKLAELRIEIENEDTGGSSGKIAEIDLRTGILSVNTTL